MSKFTLFGQDIEFSEAADRYIKWYQAISPAIQGASNDFVSYYENCDNISDVLDGYSKILVSITYDWAIEPLFKTLLNIGIYDVNEDNFQDECWDLSGAEKYFDQIADAYNEIAEGLEDAKSYRAERKASRGRVVGGGFGVGGALKGMATAGAMNAVAGLGHSLVNGIGNIASSIEASSAKKSLYNSNDTMQTLARGVRECIIDIYFAYHDFINECKDEAWFDGSSFDTEKSDTLLANSSAVPKDKRKELLIKAFIFCPFNEDLLRHIFLNSEEERENIFKVAKKYKVDLNDDLLEVLCKRYCKNAEKICETIKKFQPQFDADEKESILSAFSDAASASLDVYEVKLAEFHQIMDVLGVDESEAFDAYEYVVLDEIAENYEDIPLGKADEIVAAIIECKVSDSTKQEYIYDSDIWELFEKYEVVIPEDEKLILLFKKYQAMLMLESLSNEQLKQYLDSVIQAINFKDQNGNIPYAVKEAMFECLTGILEAKLKAQKDINDLQKDLSSDVTKNVEDIISNSGIGFMTTSLTYRQSSIGETASNLSYCDLEEDEHPFIVYDERPIMHPGEYGFCFTNKRFVGKPECGGRYDIPVSEIKYFEKKGFLSSKFILHTKGESREINAENLSELDKFVECLNKILIVIPQIAAKVSSKETKLNKQIWIVSAQCLDEHPYLIEYFGMEEKADEIYEKSGKTAERKRILEECTDENLSVCELRQLEDCLKAVRTLRIQEDICADLCAKITVYIDLIHSSKDKNTLKLLDCCADEKIEEYSYRELCNLKTDVENHKFLPMEKKEHILGIIIPRLNLLDFQRRLSDAGDKYNELISIYNNLKNEPLSPEQIEQYTEEIKELIIAIQVKHMSEITAGIEEMTHLQIKEAIAKLAYYNFDDAIMQAELKQLDKKLDEVELRTLADFCSILQSVSISDIVCFREKLKADGFKSENIAVYINQIDEYYWTLFYEKSCDECKQTIISKTITDKQKLQQLLENFENCGKTPEYTAPYIERIKSLLAIQTDYEQKKQSIISDTHNKLVSYVSETIIKSVLPQTRECYKPEVYIQGIDSLNEYSEFDSCKGFYAEDEAPVFYIFQLNGSQRIPNLSITNNAMYLAKSSSNGQIIKIPLETITELKPAKLFNEISVICVTGTGSIYSVLPYKAKVFLANAIYEIVKFIVRTRPQSRQLLTTSRNEYMQKISECFEHFPIPNDDKIVINAVNNKQTRATNNTVVDNTVPNQMWVCKCGNINKGNFCSACGGKKETSNREWICSCGSKNTANFCPSCGKRRE